MSGDRAVIFVRVPGELKYLAECYQSARSMQSFAQAITELLETHPRIAEMAERLYADMDNEPTGEVPP